MKMFKKITQRIHRFNHAFKNKPDDKITFGVDVRDCASCEYKLRCAECSLSAENARLRAELASYKSAEITAGAIRQSADEAEKDKPEPKPKPEYYSGKVVCTMGSHFHTKGKVYEVKDGVINYDSPHTGLYNPRHPKKTLEELGEPGGPQFIPFVEDKPPFDWAGFKRRDFAVNCDTKEKAKAFLAECYQHRLFWSDRDVRKTKWGVHEANTCYSFSLGTLGYTEKSWYQENDIKVIPYR